MPEQLQILLAEDNPSDVLLVRHVLQEHDIPNELHVISDGAEAISALTLLGRPNGIPRPDLLLLDMNLPKVDGPQFLSEFRRHPLCSGVPVIVFSSSDQARDRSRVQAFDVAHYFKKPASYDEFLELGALVKSAVAEHSPKARAS